MESGVPNPPADLYGSSKTFTIYTYVEVKRRESDEQAFHKRMKFAELPRDLRLSQLVDTVLRVLKCSDYNLRRRSSCYLCLPSWKPQRLDDVVLDLQKASTGAVLAPVAHLATLYIIIINEDLPMHNMESIQNFIKFYIKLCHVDCQPLSTFISQHNFPLSESDIMALISDKSSKKFHLTLTDLNRCNEWCSRIMQTHHVVTNYFLRPNGFMNPHGLGYMPDEMKPELPLGEWTPHSPNMAGGMPSMKNFTSALAMHTSSGGAVLNQHTPLLAHPASHSPHEAEYLNSVISHRLLTAPQQASTPTSAVNLTPGCAGAPIDAGASHLYRSGAHPRPPPTADDLSPSTPGSAPAGAGYERKKPQRIRTSFDADFELPYLMKRFKENPNPTKESMDEIKQILNGMPSRESKRKLDLTNIMYWFKNMRAGFRKRERLSGAATVEAAEAASDLDPRDTRRLEEDEEEAAEERGRRLRDDGRIDVSDASDEEEEEEDEEEEGSPRRSPDKAAGPSPGPPHGPVVASVIPQSRRAEENKENEIKEEAKLTHSPVDDDAADSDTEIIEGRPEDFREHEEAEGRGDLPEDLRTSRASPGRPPAPDSGLAPPPPMLPLHAAMLGRPLPTWPRPGPPGAMDEANVLAFFAQRGLPHAPGSSHVPPAAPGAKPEPGLEMRHNGDDPDGASGDSPLPGTSSRKRKRTRVFIDPTTEVPRLKEWFAVDTHPTAQMIEVYTARLNDGEYRKRQQPLEPKNVQLWFKNHRAKVKRRRLNEAPMEASNGNGFLPPLQSQSSSLMESPCVRPSSVSSNEEDVVEGPGEAKEAKVEDR